MKALVTIGALVNLEVIDPSGRLRKVSTGGRWLAWDAGRRNLVICRLKGTAPARLPSNVLRAHARFHNAPPRGKAFVADVPSPVGGLGQIGLIKALTYKVPRSVKSPNKNPHLWHHDFGDTGHKGGSYPERVMPMLCHDARGNLFIKRRKGNIYTVDEWLRG